MRSLAMCKCMGEPWKKEQKSERQNTKTNARERETDIRKTLRIGVGERAELPSLRSERKSERANERERAAATGRRTKWVAADFLEIVGGLCAFISIWKMDFQWIAVFKPRISFSSFISLSQNVKILRYILLTTFLLLTRLHPLFSIYPKLQSESDSSPRH